MKKLSLVAFVALFAFTACSSGTSTSESTESSTTAEAPAAEAADNVVSITINGGDDMKFDLSEIRVKEGQTVRLTINHTGTLAKAAMGHNWVLLTEGTVAADFAAKAIQAQATDYIPEGATEIIVHTKLIGGGESDTIEFQAPAKGAYEFLCSFPGHSSLMKGTFYVE